MYLSRYVAAFLFISIFSFSIFVQDHKTKQIFQAAQIKLSSSELHRSDSR